MSAAAAPASSFVCWAFAVGARTPKSARNTTARALRRHMHDQRLARTFLPLIALLAALALPAGAAAKKAPNGASVQAGAAVLDGTYHVGSSAGQYASTRDGGY